jgi:pimeloyl-ACP methyl ester carboxylesterase
MQRGLPRRESIGVKMKKSRFVIAVALSAAFLSAEAAPAQTIMAPEKKAVAANPAPAEKKTVVAVTSDKHKSAAHRSEGRIPVYLLRGLLNIFSLGMDDLGEKIRRRGYPVVVTNYSEWQSIADDIAAKYKAGWSGPIILIGHSYGADAVMQMGQYLGTKNVPVNLIVPFDGTASYAASANVQRVLNIYQREYAKQTRGPGFKGELINYYVSDPNVGHTTIDKEPRLHNMVLSRLGGASKPAAAPAATPAGATNTPAAPKPSGSAGTTTPHG